MALSPVGVSSPFLSLIKTLVLGFKALPNPGWSHLEILTLVTFAKTLIPNHIIFWNFRCSYFGGGPYSTHYNMAGDSSSGGVRDQGEWEGVSGGAAAWGIKTRARQESIHAGSGLAQGVRSRVVWRGHLHGEGERRRHERLVIYDAVIKQANILRVMEVTFLTVREVKNVKREENIGIEDIGVNSWFF